MEKGGGEKKKNKHRGGGGRLPFAGQGEEKKNGRWPQEDKKKSKIKLHKPGVVKTWNGGKRNTKVGGDYKKKNRKKKVDEKKRLGRSFS